MSSSSSPSPHFVTWSSDVVGSSSSEEEGLLLSTSESFAESVIGKMIFFGDREGEGNKTVFAIPRNSSTNWGNGRFPHVPTPPTPTTSSLLQSVTSLTVNLLTASNGTGHSSSGSNFGILMGPTGDLIDSIDGGDNSNNDTVTGDMSYWPLRDPLYITIPITVIYLVILVLGLLGNVVTCVVIVRSRYLHTTTNYYLFSLAVSDLLLLLSGLPAEMHSIWWRYPYVFGEYFCTGRGLAAETSSNATVLTITAFTVERYLAICRPFIMQKWQNKLSRVVRQILIIWVIAVALAIPQALQFGLITVETGPDGATALTCGVKKVLIEHSFEIATFVFFVAPMILITALYCLIGCTLRNASRVKESKLRLRKSLSGHKREAGQQRVLKMLVAVVVAFFLCWAPFHAQRLIAIWGTKYLEQNTVLMTTYHVLTYISGILYYVSTCINPILYSVMSLKFRHAFQDNVDKCCGVGEQTSQKRKRRNEVLVTITQRSLSHSHSSRSQNMVVLTTEMTALSTNLNAAAGLTPIHHFHSHSNSTPPPSLPPSASTTTFIPLHHLPTPNNSRHHQKHHKKMRHSHHNLHQHQIHFQYPSCNFKIIKDGSEEGNEDEEEGGGGVGMESV